MDLTNGTFVDETKQTAYFADINAKGDFLSSDTAASALFRYQKERDPDALWFGYEKADNDLAQKALTKEVRSYLNYHFPMGDDDWNNPTQDNVNTLDADTMDTAVRFAPDFYKGTSFKPGMALKDETLTKKGEGGDYSLKDGVIDYLNYLINPINSTIAAGVGSAPEAVAYAADKVPILYKDYNLYRHNQQKEDYEKSVGVDKMTPQEKENFYKNDEKYNSIRQEIAKLEHEKKLLEYAQSQKTPQNYWGAAGRGTLKGGFTLGLDAARLTFYGITKAVQGGHDFSNILYIDSLYRELKYYLERSGVLEMTPQQKEEFYKNDERYKSYQRRLNEAKNVRRMLDDDKFNREIDRLDQNLKNESHAVVSDLGLERHENDNEFMYNSGDVIGSFLGSAVLNTITGGGLAGKAAIAAVFGTIQKEKLYDELIDKGIEPEEANKIANRGGLIEGGIEAIGFGLLVKNITTKILSKAVFKSSAVGILENLSQKIGEEFNMWDHRKDVKWQDKLEGILMAGVYGGILGSVTAIGSRPLVNRHAADVKKDLVQEHNVEPEVADKWVNNAVYGGKRVKAAATKQIQKAIVRSKALKMGFNNQQAEKLSEVLYQDQNALQRLVIQALDETFDPETRNKMSPKDLKNFSAFEALKKDFDIYDIVYKTAIENGVVEHEAKAAALLTESYARVMFNLTGMTPAQQWENGGALMIQDLRSINYEDGSFVSQESLSAEQIAALNLDALSAIGQEVNVSGQEVNASGQEVNMGGQTSSVQQTQHVTGTNEMSTSKAQKDRNLLNTALPGDNSNEGSKNLPQSKTDFSNGQSAEHATPATNPGDTGASTDSSVFNSLSIIKRLVNTQNADNGQNTTGTESQNAVNQPTAAQTNADLHGETGARVQNNADPQMGSNGNPQHNPDGQKDNQTPQNAGDTATAQKQPVLSLQTKEEIKNHTEESFKKEQQKKLAGLENKKVFNESLQEDIGIFSFSIKNYKLPFADKFKQALIPYLPQLLKMADFSVHEAHNAAQKGEANNTAQKGEAQGANQKGEAQGTNQKGEAQGANQKGETQGGAQKGEANNTAQKGEVHNAAQKGEAQGTNQKGESQGAVIKSEKNIYLRSIVPVKIDHVIYDAILGLRVKDGELALWDVRLKKAPFQTDPSADGTYDVRLGSPQTHDTSLHNRKNVNPQNNVAQEGTRINLDETQGQNVPNANGETLSDSQGKTQTAAKKQTQSQTADDINVQGIIDGQNALDELILKSKKTGAFKGQAIFGKVSEWLKTKSRQMGLDLNDFSHVMNISDVKQIKNMSRSSQKGAQISDADIQKLPVITANPDFAVFGTDKFNLPSVILAKKMPDGSTIFVLQNATKNKTLTTKAMWKVNGGVDLSSLPAHIKRHVPFNIYKNGIQNELSAVNDQVLSEAQGIKGIQEQTQKTSDGLIEEAAPKIYRNPKGEELAFNEHEVVDTTDSYKKIEGEATEQARAKAEKYFNRLLGKSFETGEKPLKIQMTAYSKPHVLPSRVMMQKGKTKKLLSVLLNLEKIIPYAKKIDRDGTVDFSHNTRKQTQKHKKQVEQYVYFVAPVQIDGEKYFVEIAAEKMKGRKKPDILDIYNVKIKRSPLHAQSATVPDSTNTLTQKDGHVNTKNENIQQNVTKEGSNQQNVVENDGDIKGSPRHAQLSTTVRDSDGNIAQTQSDVKSKNQTNAEGVNPQNQSETEMNTAHMNADSSDAPVVSISSAQETYGLSENDHKTYLRETLQDYRDKKVFNNSLGGAIEIQTSPLNPYTTFLADENNRAIVPYVPYLLQNANFTEVQNVPNVPFGQEGYRYWTATVPVQIDGGVFDVRMNVKQSPDGRFIWDAHAENKRPSDGSVTNAQGDVQNKTPSDGSVTDGDVNRQNSDRSPAAYEETHLDGQNDLTADDLNEKSASDKVIIAEADAQPKVSNSDTSVNEKSLFQRENPRRENHLLFQVTAKVLKKFHQDLKQMEKNKSPRGSSVRLESTPFVYQVFGIKDKPIILSQQVVDKAKNAMTKDHNVPQEVIDNLPVLLSDPLMVLKSATQKGDLVVVLDAVDKSGRPVFVILRKLSNSFNVIPSIYGRDDFARFLNENAHKGRVLYVKGKARDIHGAQLPEKHRRKKKILNKDKINERYLKNLQKHHPQTDSEGTNAPDSQNTARENEANQNNVSDAAQTNEVNQNDVSNIVSTNEVTPRTTPATNLGDKGSQNPARPTLHLRGTNTADTQNTARTNGLQLLEKSGITDNVQTSDGFVNPDLDSTGADTQNTARQNGLQLSKESSVNESLTKQSDGVKHLSSLKETDNGFQVSEDVSIKFRHDVKLYRQKRMPHDIHLRVGYTPFVYQYFGMANKPLSLPQHIVQKAESAFTKDHNVPTEVIQKLPELLADPLMVLKSATQKGDLVAVLNAVDKSGRTVVAIIRATNKTYNVIPSVYGRNDFGEFIEENKNKGRLLYIKDNTARQNGLQLPKRSGVNDTIANKDQLVKHYLNKFAKNSPSSVVNAAPVQKANQNNVSDAAQTNEVRQNTASAANLGDKGSQNPARPTLHLRGTNTADTQNTETSSRETLHLRGTNEPTRPILHLRSTTNAEPKDTTNAEPRKTAPATNPGGPGLKAEQAAMADTLTQLQDLINTQSENEHLNDAYGVDETAALQTDPTTNPGVEGPNAKQNNNLTQDGLIVDENNTSTIADELGLTTDPKIQGEVFAQSAKEQNVVDLTNEFKHNPKLKEVIAYIQEIIDSGKKFGTLSPDWFIDIPHGSRSKKKLINNSNYKKLSHKELVRLNKYLSTLEQLLSNAQYVGSKRNFKTEKKSFVEKYHYFKSNVKIGNKVYEILFDTEQFKGESEAKPQTVHLYNVTEVSLEEAQKGRNLPRSASTSDNPNIAQNRANVNNNGRKVGRYVIDFTSEGWGDSEVFKQDTNNTDVMDLTQHFDHIPTTQEMQAYLDKIIQTGQKFSTLSPDWMVDVLGGKRIRKKILNSGDYKKLDHKGINRHNRYVMALEELLARAEYVGEQVNLKRDSKEFVEKYHYFKTRVKVGTHKYDVIFDTEQHIDDNITTPQTVHLYNINEVAPGGTGRKWQNLKQKELANKASVQPTAESIRNSIGPNVRNDTDVKIIEKNTENVNMHADDSSHVDRSQEVILLQQKLAELIVKAKEPGTFKDTVKMGKVDSWLVRQASEMGLEIDGYEHAIDVSAIKHIQKKHGNAQTENSRGQISITDKDIKLIPLIVSHPDYLIVGSKNHQNNPTIIYVKQMNDGSIIFVEEVRTKRQTLSANTMWKMKGEMKPEALLSSIKQQMRLKKEVSGQVTADSDGTPVLLRPKRLPDELIIAKNTENVNSETSRSFDEGVSTRKAQFAESVTSTGAEGPYNQNIASSDAHVENKSRTNEQIFNENQQNVIENQQARDTEGGGDEVYYQPVLPPDIKNKKVKVVDLTKEFKGVPSKDDLIEKIELLMKGKKRLKTQSFEKYIDFKDDADRDITGHLVNSSTHTFLSPDGKTRHDIALNSIEDLIKESVYVEKEINKKPWKRDVQEYYRFYVPVLLGKGKNKKIYVVRLVAEKLKGEKGIRPDVVHLYDVILEDSTLPLPNNYLGDVNEGAAVPPRSKGLSASGATTSEDVSSLILGVNGDANTIAQNGNGVNESAAVPPRSKGLSASGATTSEDASSLIAGVNGDLDTIAQNGNGVNQESHPASNGKTAFPDSPDGSANTIAQNDMSVNAKMDESTLKGDNSAASESNADSDLTIKVSQMLKKVQGFDKTLYRQDGARGSIVMNDVKNVIRLLQTADPSTIIHEMGHYFTIRYIRTLHKMGRMNELQPILGWLDVPGAEYMTLAHKEKLARAFETYVMEGVAPNARLKSLFKRFKVFISNVYRNLVGKVIPPEQINEDVRVFFDKMLAPDYDGKLDVDMLSDKSDALQTVANDALQGIDSTVDGVGTNDLQGLVDVMYARLPREGKTLADALREGGLQEDFMQLQESFGKINEAAGSIQDILTSDKGDKAKGVIDFLVKNGFIDPALKNDTVALTKKISAIFKNAHKLAVPLNSQDKAARENILKGVGLLADVLKDVPFEEVAKALKNLARKKKGE